MSFPALCHLTTFPETTEGYDGSVDKRFDRSLRPALLLICGTHARERVNPLIVVEFAE